MLSTNDKHSKTPYQDLDIHELQSVLRLANILKIFYLHKFEDNYLQKLIPINKFVTIRWLHLITTTNHSLWDLEPSS